MPDGHDTQDLPDRRAVLAPAATLHDVHLVELIPKGDRLGGASRILAREAAGHRLGGTVVKMVCEVLG